MKSDKKIPLRKCIVCGEMKDKSSLIRIVRESDGVITIDKTGKRNGRGAYICLNIECFNKAKKARRIEKSFRCAVPTEIYEELESHL